MGIKLAVPKETMPQERRVALVPETAAALVKKGHEIRIETGAGVSSFYADQLYSEAGSRVCSAQHLFEDADIILKIQPPTDTEIARMRPGAIVISLMNQGRDSELIAHLEKAEVTAFALELVPRISRAQSMDVLSSQATVAGYKAALLGAHHGPRFFPMLTTAAGTIRPAKVLVLGAGVAGLMAIATARRLGAAVEAYDVRRAAGEHVCALGAKFLAAAIEDAEASGGYARELSSEEKAKERAMVIEAVAKADVVITTANVPGKKAPRLIDREMLARMQPGSVIVDMAAESGGNCELTKAGEIVIGNGVTIIGPVNLASQVPFHASRLFAKNIQSFLELLLDEKGNIVSDFSDEILAASMVTRRQDRTSQAASRDSTKDGVRA